MGSKYLKSIGFVVIFSAASCSGPQVPCDYEIQTFKAEVKEIKEASPDGKIEVLLDFDVSELNQQLQSYAELRNLNIDSTFIKNNKVRLGTIYTGTVSELISGNCEQRIISFNNKLW